MGIPEKIKKLFNRAKSFLNKFFKSKLNCTVFLLAVLVLISFSIRHINAIEESKNPTKYIVLDGTYLSNIDQKKISVISRFVVVQNDNEGIGGRGVFIKYQGVTNQEKVIAFTHVTDEAFDYYKETNLTPYIQKHPDFKINYTSSTDELTSLLHVKTPPRELLAKGMGGRTLKSLGAILNALISILFLYLLFNMMSSSTETVSKVKADDITDSMDDLIGLEDVKAEILQLEDLFANREIYRKHNIVKNFNVLLTGPAGVGKTKIARCLAKRLDVPMFYSSASGLQSGYVGGGSRALKKLLKSASKCKRAIVFLDEAEVLLQSRVDGAQHWEKETINMLLSILDGVNTNNSEIIWILASNMNENTVKMDAAMLRRFQLKVNFRLPNFEERKLILEHLLGKVDEKNRKADLDLNNLASITANMSPAKLETLVERAGFIAIKESQQISNELLLRAFEREVVGLTDRETSQNNQHARNIIAHHEVGHFVVKLHHALNKANHDFSKLAEHLDVVKISTEAVSSIGALGFVLSKEKDLGLLNRREYEEQICQLYGGMACEEIYFGESGVTAGAQNDIEKVSRILTMMITQVGYYQKVKLNYAVTTKKDEVTLEQKALMESKASDLYYETKAILGSYHGLIAVLVSRLLVDYSLTIEQVLEIIFSYYGKSDLAEQSDRLEKIVA